MILYHLSDKKLNTIMKPRIPESDYEDQKTPRICFSTSIQGCLIGINEDKDITGKEYYVYTLKTDDYYRPSVKEVNDVNITDEVWYMNDYKPKFVYKIKIMKKNGEVKKDLNGKQVSVPIWKYCKILTKKE